MDLLSRLEMFWQQQVQKGLSPSLIVYSSEEILEQYLKSEIQPAKRHSMIKKCLFQSLLHKSLNCNPSFQTISAALEIISKELSLMLFKPDEENSNSVTICGEVFVIDIHIDDNGAISSVKLSASEVNEIPKEAQDYLSELALHLNFKAFEKELTMFSFLDKTNNHHPQLNLFNCLLCLQKDIAKIYELESKINSPESVLLLGHGVPLFYIRNFGASINYYGSRSIDEVESKHTYHANISIEQSTLNRFLPKSIQQSCFECDSVVLPSVEKQFCVEATLPILGGQAGVLIPAIDSVLNINAGFVLELEPTVYLTLENAKYICGTNVISATAQNISNWTGPTFEDEYVIMEFSCTSTTPMFAASKIIFSGISQVLPIFKILRQAIVFKILVSSILDISNSSNKTLFHLISWSPPQFVQIYFAHKLPPYRYLVGIAIEENGMVDVKVTTNSGTGNKIKIDNENLKEAIAAVDGYEILQAIISFLDQK